MSDFIELNSDQRREAINSRQRFAGLGEALHRVADFRGSMGWNEVKGRQYLVRSQYDASGKRKQVSLGLKTEETIQIKLNFDAGRARADERLKDMRLVMDRQAAVNRALALGRVPLLGARIIRALDDARLLGNGLRVLGTYALFAYEAAAGVFIDPGLTTTEDIDLLLDARHGLSFSGSETVEEASLLALLQRVDRSFERSRQTFRAINRDGYLVDLIKPMRNPPWQRDTDETKPVPGDLDAAEISGLVWHESAPSFEAVCIDDRGQPLRIVTSDPRVWAVHKMWLSERPDRDALKRKRDGLQAQAAARLVSKHMPHLPFEPAALRMLPKDIVEKASGLFTMEG